MEIHDARRHLDNLYGVPGEANETDMSMIFIEKLFREMGVSALTEEAIVRLGELQYDYENQPRY